MLLSVHRLIEDLAEQVAQSIVFLFQKIRQPSQGGSTESKRRSSPPPDSAPTPPSEDSDVFKQPIDSAAEGVADRLIQVGYIFWDGLKSIPRRLARYFQFLLYLNWNTVKTVAVRTVEQIGRAHV